MRGREAEVALIDDVLRRVRGGRCEVVLVEGPTGTGKSCLLAEAATIGRARDFRVIGAAANELERAIPLCPLLVAFGESTGLITDIPADDTSSQVRAIARVREHVQGLTEAGPVLVGVDDVQFADPATLLALRLLPRQLSGRPVAWLLTRTMERESDAESLFSLLRKDGASQAILGSLPDEAVEGLAADLAGGKPDESVLAMLAGAAGNPLLIRELMTGLLEENLLRASGGQVTLVAERIPGRLRGLILDQLSRLGQPIRQLLEAAALLGHSFAVVDIADMLGQPPAAMLSALDEALASGILVTDGNMLSFRDTFTWRVAADAVPEPIARALHLQFAEILLGRGSTLSAASYLLKGAWRGDRRELDLLTGTAVELMPSSPGMAADLALRSVELTPAEDSAWLNRSLVAIRSLVAARRLKAARVLAEATLSHPMTIAEQAELRCGLAAIYTLTERPDQARAQSLWVLEHADVPESTRLEASVLLLRALAELPDRQEAEGRAQALATSREGNVREVTAAVGVLAALRWRQGCVADGLRMFREAVSGEWSSGHDVLCPFGAQLDLASRLIDIRQLDEAKELIGAPVEDASMASVAELQARLTLLRARIHLAEGNLDAAAGEARAALSAVPPRDGWCYDTVAICLLARIALRRGDLPECESWLDQLPTADPGPPPGRLSVVRGVMRALAAAQRADPDTALAPITWLYDSISEHKWLLLSEPDVAPSLVRLALAAGDQQRAGLVTAEADHLGRSNKEFSCVAASGKHAAGLMFEDAGLLNAAVQAQPDPWARASAAEDLAGLLLAGNTSTNEAIAYFDLAHQDYSQVGAKRDMARVRQRLRSLGVARRNPGGPRERQVDGWASLTETEAGIAELVARGLTNQQIAEQSFISKHTVAFHLRQIFRKLGVTSRVELARLTLAGRDDVG
jgi:DNA-binding CsgD family transcriptional regulator